MLPSMDAKIIDIEKHNKLFKIPRNSSRLLPPRRISYRCIFFLLSTFGVDIRSNAGKSRKFRVHRAIVFHIIWLATVSNAVACFDSADMTYHCFTMIKYICSMLSWWILERKKAQLNDLKDDLDKLRQLLRSTNNTWYNRCIRVANFMFLFIVFGPGVICCVKLLIVNQNPKFFCPYIQYIMANYGKNEARALHFFVLTAFNYSSLGLPYAVAVCYCFYCIELTRLAKKLISLRSQATVENMSLNNMFNLSLLKEIHFIGMKVTRKFEATFTSLVFLLIVNSFLEIFRIETVILMYLKGRWQLDVFVHALYYSTIAMFSLLSIIISADRLQNNLNFDKDRGESLKSSSVPTLIQELLDEIRSWREIKQVRLTAFGMFKIKRDLFLSMTALYISYGVIIAQFTA